MINKYETKNYLDFDELHFELLFTRMEVSRLYSFARR